MLTLVASTLVLCAVAVAQQTPNPEPPYSGPQVGELLPGFVFRQVLGSDEAKELDLVKKAGDGPIVLVFVHDVNRPSIALTRTLTRYTHSRAQDGLTTGVILLGDDASGSEASLKRIQHALTSGVPTGISIDGREGPGAYGLNRLVQLTILVGNHGKVTANYALVQPSLQVDLPKIISSVIEQVGGPEPELRELLDQEPGMQRGKSEAQTPSVDSDRLRGLLRPLIRKDAEEGDVDAAALAIEKEMEKEPAMRNEIHRIASTIVNSGKLENYGTPRAREILKTWSEKLSPVDKP